MDESTIGTQPRDAQRGLLLNLSGSNVSCDLNDSLVCISVSREEKVVMVPDEISRGKGDAKRRVVLVRLGGETKKVGLACRACLDRPMERRK